jgi:hypothetical protein
VVIATSLIPAAPDRPDDVPVLSIVMMERVVGNCASKISLPPYRLHALCMRTAQCGSQVGADLTPAIAARTVLGGNHA